MSQPKKGKLGAVAKVVGAAQDLYNETAPITSAYTPLKAADRAAAGSAAARGVAGEDLIKASEALGRAREKGFRKVTQTQADRTRVGGGNIGGPQFSALSLYDPNYAGRVWGVMDEGTASRLKNLSDPEHVFTTMLGSPDQLKTNPVVFDKLKRQFMREVKAGNLPPELLEKINAKLAQVRSGKEGPVIFGEGVDILDPDLWRNLDTFEKRAAVADMMRGEGVGGLTRYRMTKKGDRSIGGTIFDAPGVLRGETDPMLLHPEMGGDVETFSVGPRLFSLKGTSEYRPDMHPGFPTLLHGEDLGVKYNPVPSEVFLPDWYKEWKAAPNKEGNPKTAKEIKRGPGYYPLALGMEGRGLPSQAITDEYIRHLIREGYADGGEVQGGLTHMAPGGVVGTAPRTPTNYMGVNLTPVKPPSATPYKAPPAPVFQPAPVTPASLAALQNTMRQNTLNYISTLTKAKAPTPAPAPVAKPYVAPAPVKPVLTGPQVQAKSGTVPKTAPAVVSKVAPKVATPPPKPAPAPVMQPGLSKMSTSIFRKGGEVHAATGGYYTAEQMKAFNIPTAKPVVAPPSNKALTGPQIQAMSKPVATSVVAKPPVVAPKPTGPMTGQQFQATLGKVPVAPAVVPKPTPAPPIKAAPVVAPKAPTPVAKAPTPAAKAPTPVPLTKAPTVTSVVKPAAPVAAPKAPTPKAPPAPVKAPVTPTPVAPKPAAPAPVAPPASVVAPPIAPPVAPPVVAPPVVAPPDTSAPPTVPAVEDDLGIDSGFLAWLKSQGFGKKAGGSIRMASGGSVPEGVIRHMKRAAIAARMHKAQGGRING